MKILNSLIALALCAGLSGCDSLNNTRQSGHSMVNAMFPTPIDRSDDFEDENRVDRDHEQMMLQSRKGMAASNEVDGWWSDKIMSSKARSIERSLGVEYE